ncbi:MAG: MGH1-like glycoside hydrolase domain-containing protein [Acidobacteriota bacterium]
MNRRDFVSALAAASAALKLPHAFAFGREHSSLDPKPTPSAPPTQGGFPASDYTPFGYLDNPWHTWNLHPGGVLRSVPGIGFALYYPAGPGGYFDFHRNNVYTAELTLGFRIGDRTFFSPDDFAHDQLSSPHHSKNVLAFAFEESGMRVTSSFFLVNEDCIAAQIQIDEKAGRPHSIEWLAAHTYVLGGSQWWGGDGVTGGFDAEQELLWTRGFAAGTVFGIAATLRGEQHYFSGQNADRATWLTAEPRTGAAVSYGTDPLCAGVRYRLDIAPHSLSRAIVILQRAPNLGALRRSARASLAEAHAELDRRHVEDAAFWSSAPVLAGDWPEVWKRGWVYDFETLRTMVRRPIGVYRHPWDAMQLQAPRNVLAETSIDMWALSYANPEMAKEVFAGQFLDAIEPNIPCMREDGVMNMVAADGSECGTSISWCFPLFCAASIFDRTRDQGWLRRLYPGLAALLRWTLKHRTDAQGFVVGKCSWETGMDTSRRFQIEQPTGGELVEFLPLVELQAAASQAGAILARFAQLSGDEASVSEWRSIEKTYAGKTQQLWQDDWFHDFDSRTMKLVIGTDRDPSQASPAFCGIATDEQKKLLTPTLHRMYASLLAEAKNPKSSAQNQLNWSSFVLPFLESAWASGDRQLASSLVETICNRIYSSMDRRSAAPADADHPRLGWPGVSCEIWGAHGAFGGEVYGWGAVMPAHLVRSVIGLRETDAPYRAMLAPAFPSSLSVKGNEYAIERLPWCGHSFTLRFRFLDESRLRISISGSGPLAVREVLNEQQQRLPIRHDGASSEVELTNFSLCTIVLKESAAR